jgi:hypothetical protein
MPDWYNKPACLQYNREQQPPGPNGRSILTLSDPMPDRVQHYDFPVPDAFLDL